MKIPYVSEEVKIPEGVEVTVENNVVRVKGPLGELVRDFSKQPVTIRKEGNTVIVECYFAKKRERALIGTIAKHIKNMIIGVTKGFRYRMKIVYAHFPMSVKVEGDKVIIENFLGQKDKKVAKIVGDVKVKVEKDEVIIEGIDIEKVSQTAANIHNAVRLRGKNRPCPHGREGGPGVLDGIYLYQVELAKTGEVIWKI